MPITVNIPKSVRKSSAIEQTVEEFVFKLETIPRGTLARSAHQHKRYCPPADVTATLLQLTLDPLAVNSTFDPDAMKRGMTLALAQVSNTK
jgi:hypothetical protein